MTTETKIIGGISLLTLLIIVGGIFLFNSNKTNNIPGDYSRYINTGLSLDISKLSRPENPKITGAAKNASSTELSAASSSKILITEFLDYECPACAVNGEMLTKQLLETYGDRVIITRKIFPVHNQGSIDSARLVLASQIFGGDIYEKVHAKFFETLAQWSILSRDDRTEFFKKIIVDLGVDYDKLLVESQDKKYDEQIAKDRQDALDLEVKATPTFIIGNHTRITGGLPLAEFVKYIDSN